MTTPRLLKPNIFSSNQAEYLTQQPWPESAYLQFGRSGLVFDRANNSTYRTAFFEAFWLGKFWRGEGMNVFEAENDCWQQYIRWYNNLMAMA